MAASLALVVLVAAGCGGSSPGGRRTAGSTSTTLSPTAVAVVAAYRAAKTAFDQAVARADPTWPALDQSMTGTELKSVKRILIADQLNGIVGRGPVQVYPKLFSISGDQAVVHDCLYSASELMYQKTGKPVPPLTPPEHDGVSATLQQVAPGVWKVASVKLTEGSCPPGY
ncbi:MAG: hypothetical protein ACYCUG_00870 [Acidimicrobiales bacterium]